MDIHVRVFYDEYSYYTCIYMQDGTPMLLIPAQKGFSMVTQYLLENDANPNIPNKVFCFTVYSCMP